MAKQSLIFLNTSKYTKQPFVTNDLMISVEQGMNDPQPLNRKSRRAMPKLIKKLLKRK